MEKRTFLYEVAERLVHRFGKELYRVAIVFPNRRQAVYFREHVQGMLTVPALLPEMLTIEELVTRSSDYALADPVRQSFALYKAYQSVESEAGNTDLMSYEDFYGLGETLLSDLNETDAYGVSTERIFSIIADYKEIDQQFEELTEEQRAFLKSFWQSVSLQDGYQQRFADLWRKIPLMYGRMHNTLQQEGFSTLGLMYRQLATLGPILPDTGWLHVAFVGFNAFNGAEERFIKTWQEAGLATLWLDVDAYYLDNSMHEAGYFFRRNLQKLGLKNEMPTGEYIPAKGKDASATAKVQVTRVEGQVAQAKLVAGWVNQLPTNLTTGKAAILLADEKLLLPVLQSLPKTHHTVNITMGYPVAQSPLYSLLELFFAAQKVLEGKKPGKGSLPWQVVMQWLHHPLNDWAPDDVRKQKEAIISKGLQWVTVDGLLKMGGTANWIFTALPDRGNLFNWLRNLLQEVAKNPATHGDTLLQGLLSGLYENIVAMEPQYAGFLSSATMEFLQSIILKPLSAISVPFEAESTAGIQVMGLLESRGIDFDYILLLGAGEGSLPRVAAAKTFIPYNLRKAFGLSTLEHQDAIFAWVFYRLLHRCRHLHAVYNGLVTDNSTGEVSRFIQQLRHESGFAIESGSMQLPVKATPSNTITIAKSDVVLNNLRKYYSSDKPVPLSPSAINKYLACRLQFFFQYIANISEPDEMVTEIDAAMFGTAVHSLLETLYERWMKANEGKPVTEEAIDEMIQWIPEYVNQCIHEAWTKQKNTTHQLLLQGFSAVVADVVGHFTQSFLKIDKDRTPFKVHHTEVAFDYGLQVKTVDGLKTIKLKGNIDRVDEKDGVVRMVDFKTGSDQVEFQSLEQLFEPHGDNLNKGALQTLLYALLFSKSRPEYPHFEPALIALRSFNSKRSNSKTRLQEKETKIELNTENMPGYLPRVEENIKLLLEELFNPDVAFNQTEDFKVCGYCDFKGICGR